MTYLSVDRQYNMDASDDFQEEKKDHTLSVLAGGRRNGPSNSPHVTYVEGSRLHTQEDTNW